MEEEESKKNYLKYFLGAVALLVGIGIVVAIVVIVILHYTTPSSTESPSIDLPPTSAPNFLTSKNIFDYYPEANNDGLNIKFAHAANEYETLQLALSANTTDVVEGDVCLRYYGSPSQKDDQLVMMDPPEQISDLTLDEWLDLVIPTGNVIKLDFTIDEIIPLALESLKNRTSSLCQPVWINAEVVVGPNAREDPVNFTSFNQQLNDSFPYVTVSLGWTNTIRYVNKPEFTWKMMDDMLAIMRKVSQRIAVMGRAALLKNSWDKFLWLLEQSDEYWFAVYDQPYDVVQAEDVAFVRDNMDNSRVFYDVSDATRQNLLEILDSPSRTKYFYTGGNVLDYFRIQNREAIKVTWAHRVLTREDLNFTLNDDKILMLETDIRIFGEGTQFENKSLPVMAHDPPALDYDLTFEQWLDKVTSSNQSKGIKLDFKSIDSLAAALPILTAYKPKLRIPIWINSDVMEGPNSATRPRNATLFFSLIQDQFPDVTLSPGWTTTYRPSGNNEYYSQDMVEKMYEACRGMRQAITFPVRASLSRSSIPEFQWLLSQSNRYSLTLWHSTSEIVLIEDLIEVYKSFHPSKVYYDLPEEIMKEFLEAIMQEK